MRSRFYGPMDIGRVRSKQRSLRDGIRRSSVPKASFVSQKAWRQPDILQIQLRLHFDRPCEIKNNFLIIEDCCALRRSILSTALEWKYDSYDCNKSNICLKILRIMVSHARIETFRFTIGLICASIFRWFLLARISPNTVLFLIDLTV